MRMKPIMVLAASALVGLVAAYFVSLLNGPKLPDLPPNVFVGADQQSLVELPDEPKPLPPEPRSLPVLLHPEPMPALSDGREVTVSLRQPVEGAEEEEALPELIPAPAEVKTLGLLIADPEEAPPSPELIAMPTEEAPAMPKHDVPLPLPAVVLTFSRPCAFTRGEGILWTGTYVCNLEGKTYLTLPESVCQQLGCGANELYVGLAPDRNSLWIYPRLGVDQLVRRLIRPSNNDNWRVGCLRLCLSRLWCVFAQMEGIFSLPPELIDAARLGKNVMLIGMRDHLELWDADSWKQYSDTKPQADAASRRMNELLKSSEQSGPTEYDWGGNGFTEQPSRLTPERTHGGIQ